MNRKGLSLIFDEKVLKKLKKDFHKDDLSFDEFMIKAL